MIFTHKYLTLIHHITSKTSEISSAQIMLQTGIPAIIDTNIIEENKSKIIWGFNK